MKLSNADDWGELKEKLAAIEHERWADWQKWCHKILRANVAFDIEPTLARWEKQIKTPYSKLTRPEQLSDLEQVDRYLPLIKAQLHQALIAKMPSNKKAYKNRLHFNNGYNMALDEVNKILDNFFGVSDE